MLAWPSPTPPTSPSRRGIPRCRRIQTCRTCRRRPREEEQPKVKKLIALKTLKQKGDAKVPEGNSETKETNLQDLQEEAQGLTITTAREEELRRNPNKPDYL